MTVRRAPRQRSRQVALQVLYAIDLGQGARDGATPPTDDVFERVAANFDLPEGARAFAKELVCGIASRRAELDELFGSHATNWRVDRMAAVDRNVLRIGAYELAHTATPVSIVLDEAIEMARRFGSDRSPSFVNGVLDAVAHSVRPPEEQRR